MVAPLHRQVKQLAPTWSALGLDPTGMSREELYQELMMGPVRKDGKRHLRRILGTSTKIVKGEKQGVLTAVVYMAAADRSGVNLCPMASAGCKAACLGHTTGRLVMDQAQRAQLYKAAAWVIGRQWFLEQLDHEIRLHVRRAEREGMKPAIRLNGSTDILWERYGVPQRHPAVTFYDYTKFSRKARRGAPSNYHLTFSLDERDDSMARAIDWLDHGGNVAAVVAAADSVRKKDAQQVARQVIEHGMLGFPAIDGDETDIRFDDEPGSWVVLYAKGRQALSDVTGFVRRIRLAA